jgi:hypothetical protein
MQPTMANPNSVFQSGRKGVSIPINLFGLKKRIHVLKITFSYSNLKGMG